jgi:Ca-activated chloride channel family protein
VAHATFEDQNAADTGATRDSRAVLLISDGEAVSGNAGAAVESLAKLSHIFVIGVGDPRGTTVQYTNRFVRGDVPAETHVSRLDESALQEIALSGGGGYIRSTASNRDVQEIHGLIGQLFARGLDSDLEHRLVNRYQWPLAGAVFCFIGEGLWCVLLPWLGGRRDRRRAVPGEGAQYA